MQTFGDYLKRLRELEDLTIAELGERLGFSPQYISQLEKGHRRASVEQALYIADTLGIDPSRAITIAISDQFERLGLGHQYRVKLFKVS